VFDLAIARSFSTQVPLAVAAGAISVEYAIRNFVVSRGVCKHVLAAQAVAFRTVVAGAFSALTVPVKCDRRTRHGVARFIGHDPLCTKLRTEQDDIEQLLASEAQDCTKEYQQGLRRTEAARSAK